MPRNILYILLFPIFLLFSSSCRAPVLDVTAEKESYIVFGEGGGFAGLESRAAMTRNGLLFSYEPEGSTYRHIGAISRDDASQIFSVLEGMNIASMDVQAPENTYRFLEWKAKEGTNRLVWKKISSEGVKNLDIIYQLLKKHQREYDN